MAKAYTLDGNVIVMHKELTVLDIFVKDFLDILKKHTSYLIVSGFVSIATGRVRGTEDVDILIPTINGVCFRKLFDDLVAGGFWCYQSDDVNEAYSYITALSHIRFARNGEMFPNIEFIPVNETKKTQFFELHHPQKMRIQSFDFDVPPLEFEILYKETVLRSPKDIADAKHLRTVFADILHTQKFESFKTIIKHALP